MNRILGKIEIFGWEMMCFINWCSEYRDLRSEIILITETCGLAKISVPRSLPFCLAHLFDILFVCFVCQVNGILYSEKKDFPRTLAPVSAHNIDVLNIIIKTPFNQVNWFCNWNFQLFFRVLIVMWPWTIVLRVMYSDFHCVTSVWRKPYVHHY